MKTGTITYNVNDRGRQYRGTPRRFDNAGLAAVVNSNEVQERVKQGDLWGYYGHWPRMLFGMSPGEGGVVQSGPLAGKVVRLEPAFVTRSLAADAAGNVRHEAEFADTPTGRTAKRLFLNKKGGFSSAIDCRPRNGVDVPVGFYGFDYVSEPNFATNRGYALDGVMEGAEDTAILDGAISESQVTLRALDGLYTALQGDYDRICDLNARIEAENRELIALLVSKRPDLTGRLDSIVGQPFERGGFHSAHHSSLIDMAREFEHMPLATREAESPVVDPETSKLRALLTQFSPFTRR